MSFPKPKFNAYELQSKSDGTRFYLARNGQFFHAFDDCARLIAYYLKYRLTFVSNENYKDGTVKIGFPIDSLSKVVDTLTKKSNDVLVCEKNEVDLVVLKAKEKIEIPHVEAVASIGKGEVSGDILGRILSLSIAETTPLKALQILGELQVECRKLMNC